jgi:hypothetical protein
MLQLQVNCTTCTAQAAGASNHCCCCCLLQFAGNEGLHLQVVKKVI